MTRINCVPPQELCDKHLVAEYYELPRVFTAVRQNLAKGVDPATVKAPDVYTLGTGHMKFFFTRLGYLSFRQADIVLEMMRRRMKPNPDNIRDLGKGIPKHLFGSWEPDETALELNRARLEERKKAMESKRNERSKKVAI